MISSPIEVQLVGQSALLLILPAIAIVISVFSIGLTLWLRRRDDAHLDISIAYAIPVPADELVHYVTLTATNKGRAGTTVLRSLEIRDRLGRGITPTSRSFLDDQLPKTLGPGESARVALRLDMVVDVVKSNKLDLRRGRVIATTGHGTVSKVLSKKSVRTLSGPE